MYPHFPAPGMPGESGQAIPDALQFDNHIDWERVLETVRGNRLQEAFNDLKGTVGRGLPLAILLCVTCGLAAAFPYSVSEVGGTVWPGALGVLGACLGIVSISRFFLVRRVLQSCTA